MREYWSIGSDGEHLGLTLQRAAKHELTQNLVPQEGKWPLSPCQPVDNGLGAINPSQYTKTSTGQLPFLREILVFNKAAAWSYQPPKCPIPRDIG